MPGANRFANFWKQLLAGLAFDPWAGLQNFELTNSRPDAIRKKGLVGSAIGSTESEIHHSWQERGPRNIVESVLPAFEDNLAREYEYLLYFQVVAHVILLSSIVRPSLSYVVTGQEQGPLVVGGIALLQNGADPTDPNQLNLLLHFLFLVASASDILWPTAFSLPRRWARSLAQMSPLKAARVATMPLAIFGIMGASAAPAGCHVSWFFLIIPVFAGQLGGGRALAELSVLTLASIFIVDIMRARDTAIEFEPLRRLIYNSVCRIAISVLVSFSTTRLLRRIEDAEIARRSWDVVLNRDIRTPLHGLLGLLDELPAPHSAADPKSHSLRTASGCAKVIGSVIDSMFVEPNSDLAKRQLQCVVRSEELAEEIELLAASIAGRKGIRVKVDSCLDSECLQLNTANFYQILGNFMSNAVKFAPQNSEVKIGLSGSSTADVTLEDRRGMADDSGPHKFLLLRVDDEGPGVAVELQEQIFTAFDRGHRSSLGSKDGVGLGLSIVRDLVAGGGRVECQSRADGKQGASFVVSFPCEMAGIGDASAPDEEPQYDMSHERILLVDDNAMNLRVIRRLVTTLGIPEQNLCEANSGEVAVELVRGSAEPFSFAILDFMLPGIDGAEVARQISAIQQRRFPNADLRMVGATALVHPSVERAWGAAGVKHFMLKPFRRDTVKSLLNRVIRERDDHANNLPKWRYLDDNAPGVGIEGETTSSSVLKQHRSALLRGLLFLGGLQMLIIHAHGGKNQLYLVGAALCLVPMFLSESMLHRIFSVQIMFPCFLVLEFVNALSLCSSISIANGAILLGCIHGSKYVFPAVVSGSVMSILATSWRMEFTEIAACPAEMDNNHAALLVVTYAASTLLYLSAVMQANHVRERWTNTLSHDLRAPLQGMLQALDDYKAQLNSSTDTKTAQKVRIAKTSAQTLLSITETVLALASRRMPRVEVMNCEELPSSLNNLASLVMDSGKFSVSEKWERGKQNKGGEGILCQRAFLLSALSQFVASVPLLCADKDATVEFYVSFLGECLLVQAQESNRRCGIHSVEQDPSLLTSSRVVHDMMKSGRSSLLRVAEGLLGGRVTILRDNTADEKPSWQLNMAIPVEFVEDREDYWRASNGLSKLSSVIIDDSPVCARILRRQLADCGITKDPLVFLSSTLALHRLNAGDLDHMDLIFTDGNMPGIDGHDICLAVSKRFPRSAAVSTGRRGPGPVVIICTGDSFAEVHDIYRAEGAGGVLVKPYEGADILRTLAKAGIPQPLPVPSSRSTS